MDAVPLAPLLLMLRQPGPWDPEPDGFSMSEMDLLDWAAANGKKPGDDMSGFFET